MTKSLVIEKHTILCLDKKVALFILKSEGDCIKSTT